MITQLLTDLMKVGISIGLGLFMGYERSQQQKPAGIRDVALVTLGATLFAIIGLSFIEPKNMDMTRLLYAPIIGIGFLGSGVILQNKNKIEGLTTAGLLWISVATGLLVGIGNYALAIVSALAVFLILKLKHITIKIEGNNNETKKHRNNKKN